MKSFLFLYIRDENIIIHNYQDEEKIQVMRLEVKAEREDIILSFKYLFGLDHKYSYLTRDMRKILEQVLKKIELNKLTLLAQQLSSLLTSLIYDNFLLERILSEEFIKVYLQLIFKKDFSHNPGYLLNLFYSFFKDFEKLYWYIGETSDMIKDTPAGERSEEECYNMLIPTLEITKNGDFRIESELENLEWLFKELNELLKPLGIVSPKKTQISTKYPYLRSQSLLYEKSVLRRKLKEKAKKSKIERKPLKGLKQQNLFGGILSNEELEKSLKRVEKKINGKIQEAILANDILDLVRKFSDFFQVSNSESLILIKSRILKSKPNAYPMINKFLGKLSYISKFKDKPQMELFQRLQKRYSDLSNFILNEYDTTSTNTFKRLTTFLQILIDLTKNYKQYFADYYLRNYITNIKISIRENRIYVNSNLFSKDYKLPINLKDLANQVSEQKYNWFKFIYYHWD